jgi:MFS family permease
MSHDGPETSGANFFIALICIIGVAYGGGVALLYSIVFDVFGARNYRAVFGVILLGFALAIAVGGLSSAYSFASSTINIDTAGKTASSWFYAMAGACTIGLFVLMSMRPIDFNTVLQNRLKNGVGSSISNPGDGDDNIKMENHKIDC